MKIINLKTNNIFNLPSKSAEILLKEFPDEFARLTKNNKVVKKNTDKTTQNSILTKILDE
ncbi:MAG: hypothetical protein LUB59_05210 [Candidatus Gastranaerophilales bacterium]|nr:hypothetical protein [Candidatus Gastranaerophilales bacterium]